MLHRALIRLDAGELEAGRRRDRLGDLDHRLGRRDAAASGAAVDLDEALDRGAVPLGGVGQVGDVVDVVDADDHLAAVLREPRQAVDLGRVSDLVRHEDFLDAGAGEDLGLAHLLAADPDRAAELHLEP